MSRMNNFDSVKSNYENLEQEYRKNPESYENMNVFVERVAVKFPKIMPSRLQFVWYAMNDEKQKLEQKHNDLLDKYFGLDQKHDIIKMQRLREEADRIYKETGQSNCMITPGASDEIQEQFANIKEDIKYIDNSFTKLLDGDKSGFESYVRLAEKKNKEFVEEYDTNIDSLENKYKSLDVAEVNMKSDIERHRQEIRNCEKALENITTERESLPNEIEKTKKERESILSQLNREINIFKNL